MDANILLSDKFVEFSSSVVALHEKKKELKELYKAAQEKFKKDINDLDTQALRLQYNFDNWVAEQEASSKKK